MRLKRPRNAESQEVAHESSLRLTTERSLHAESADKNTKRMTGSRSSSSTPEPTSEPDARKYTIGAAYASQIAIADPGAPAPSPSPPPLPAHVSRSATMPGSFFPRSASLQPSEPPSPEEISRRVRFAHPRQDPDVTDTAKLKARSRSKLREEVAAIPEEDACGLQHDGTTERSMTHDPSKPVRRERSREKPTNGPSTATAVDREAVAEDSAGHISDRLSEKARSKQRAPVHEADTSSEIRVRGKESELRAAREAHARILPTADEEERERDKIRIKLLEEEVERLRAQVRAFVWLRQPAKFWACAACCRQGAA